MVVAGDHAVDFGVEHVADEIWVDSVNDELEPLAGELVVDLVDALIECEQAFAARLLGQRDEQRSRARPRRGLCVLKAIL